MPPCRGAGESVANEAGDSDDTVAVTAGKVSVLFAANEAMVVTKGDGGVPVERNKSRKVKRLAH